jgi:hypothetical protein
MDLKDPARLMNSELNKFKIFNESDKGWENLNRFEPAAVQATSNKEYIKQEKSVASVKSGFDHTMTHPFNNPHTSHRLALHPNSSKFKGFYLA